jgi:hypothetical protein
MAKTTRGRSKPGGCYSGEGDEPKGVQNEAQWTRADRLCSRYRCSWGASWASRLQIWSTSLEKNGIMRFVEGGELKHPGTHQTAAFHQEKVATKGSSEG